MGFKKFTVRGLKKAKRQIGIALMALNMKKMAGRPFSYSYNFKKKGRTIQNFFGNSEWFFYFKGLLSQPLLLLKDMITEKANHLTEDFNVLKENGVHCVILRLQAETGLLFEEPFTGSLVVVVHGDDNVTVAGG